MSFLISLRTEISKTKGTSAFWITVIGATFVPFVYLLLFLLNPKETIDDMGAEPWTVFIERAWQIFCFFILPISVILLTTLVTQIEFRNNTWKQVFTSPQSIGNIFFSKYLTIQVMILSCFLLFNLLIFAVGIIADLSNPGFPFLEHKIDWQLILKINLKTYIAILAMSAIQYWLSLRFKNFVASIGIGLLFEIGVIITFAAEWEHIYKYPYAFPVLSLDSAQSEARPFLENHELNSLGYFAFFILLAFLDMKTRKEKG
jgi:hypothetical protein